MKLYNIKLRVISVQYSSLTIKSTPYLLINIVYREYPLYEIESGLNHMHCQVTLSNVISLRNNLRLVGEFVSRLWSQIDHILRNNAPVMIMAPRDRQGDTWPLLYT